MSYDIMHDIETLSSANNAAVVAIGAVAFDRLTYEEVAHFYCLISPRGQTSRDISLDTMKWWMSQPDDVRAEAFSGKTSLTEALSDYAEFVKGHNPKGVWGNGSDFDNVILRNAFESVSIPCPWHYRASRCFRTAMALGLKTVEIEIPSSLAGKPHHALDDARRQLYLLSQSGLSL